MAGKRVASSKSSRSSKRSKLPDPEEIVPIEEVEDDVEEAVIPLEAIALAAPPRNVQQRDTEGDDGDYDVVFDGNPLPAEEARQRWPHRYMDKKKVNTVCISAMLEDSPKEFMQAVQHYTMAKEGSITYNLGDDAFVQAGEGEDSYICKIVEMFKATDGSDYFTAQWYYRAKDTAIKTSSHLINNKRVFFSEIKDDNPLNCLLKNLNIVRLPLDMESSEREAATSDCDFYCDMIFLLPYSTFMKLPIASDHVGAGSESDSTISSDVNVGAPTSGNKSDFEDVSQVDANKKPEITLLDLYAGCGGMSTGLSLGANAAGANLVTKWAVDINQYACESLRFNHPETHVRNEAAEDFLALLKKWAELCETYIGKENQGQPADVTEEEEEDDDDGPESGDNGEVYEVEKILDICYGDPNESGKRALYFKIKWKNYGPEFDTWEPEDCLIDCKDRLKEFVVNGHHSKILPLPGNIDMICGGPPCQGISGFNRFRDKADPFKDEKNKQLLVYMEIIEYLKPKFVLMENVVDILKFAGGLLGRYALSRLISMNYQTRLGMMAAGNYGLPQFRMRVFLWGACPTEKLPQYPLPTCDCVFRGVVPTEFDSSYVRPGPELEKKLFLGDAISDLPPVDNEESRDEMPYGGEPKTEFQKFIRSLKDGSSNQILYDHRPLQLNTDDIQRVCQIPKEKGANFRNLQGVMVGENNKVKLNPDVPRPYLKSGKPLVPDYALSFINGTSSKPFGRLWWDETVPTVITRAEPHNHALLHPLQDRVLTVRENARLQGFPDYYKLFGPIKERYIQVGNAVAVPVSRALGYSLGLAIRGTWSMEPVVTLPKKFPNIIEVDSQATDEILVS